MLQPDRENDQQYGANDEFGAGQRAILMIDGKVYPSKAAIREDYKGRGVVEVGEDHLTDEARGAIAAGLIGADDCRTRLPAGARMRSGSETLLDIAATFAKIYDRPDRWVQIPGRAIDYEFRRASRARAAYEWSGTVLEFLRSCPEALVCPVLTVAVEAYNAEAWKEREEALAVLKNRNKEPPAED